MKGGQGICFNTEFVIKCKHNGQYAKKFLEKLGVGLHLEADL